MNQLGKNGIYISNYLVHSMYVIHILETKLSSNKVLQILTLKFFFLDFFYNYILFNYSFRQVRLTN